MKKTMNMNSSNKHLVTLNDFKRANELNDFFLRSNARNNSPLMALDALSNFADCVKTDSQRVKSSIFRKLCNTKAKAQMACLSVC